MSELRPSGGGDDGAAQLLASARARVAAATAELALPSLLRLTERERLTASSLIEKLLRAIEDELRSALSDRFSGEAHEALRAALSSASLPLALPTIEKTGALAEPSLVALILRRAEEHRLARAAREASLLTDLSGDADSDVAAAAVSLLIALSRRLDSFQEPAISPGDVPAETEHMLVWGVAAALRQYIVVQHAVAPAEADEAVASAAAALLARHDEGAGADALARRLALQLEEKGRLDDSLIAAAAREGALPLFVAAIGARTQLDSAAVWELLTEPTGRGIALLLRGADLSRAVAASILLAFASDEESVSRQLDVFDGADADAAGAMLSLWRRDPAYRAAVARLAA
jgi:uncharacterized protein (DUF2336 family)